MHEYDDIINIKIFNSKHERMSIEKRSAQFASFKALVGYSDEVLETERITDNKIILDDEKIKELNELLLKIKNNDLITIEYFVNDLKKSGGRYITKTNYVKKIDYYDKKIIFKDNSKIPINNIINVKFE